MATADDAVTQWYKDMMSTSAVAVKRLKTEHQELLKNPPNGFIAGPTDQSNYLRWDAIIYGPPGTYWEGGAFPLKMCFPADYPLHPPLLKFTERMFHPNVRKDGRVRMSMLSTFDPVYPAVKWRPVETVQSVLRALLDMLIDPNLKLIGNSDAAYWYVHDPHVYEFKVRHLVRRNS